MLDAFRIGALSLSKRGLSKRFFRRTILRQAQDAWMPAFR